MEHLGVQAKSVNLTVARDNELQKSLILLSLLSKVVGRLLPPTTFNMLSM